MTGKRLYELYTEELHLSCYAPRVIHGRSRRDPPPAWAFLHYGEQGLWVDLAKRIAPKRRAR